jgi:hypothetical protein
MSTELKVADGDCKIQPRDIAVPSSRVMYNVIGSYEMEVVLAVLIMHFQKKGVWSPFTHAELGEHGYAFSSALGYLVMQGNILVERDGTIQQINHPLITDKLHLSHRVVARCYGYHPAY